MSTKHILACLLIATCCVRSVWGYMPDNLGGVSGTTYYVDAGSGDDNDTGLSVAAAWATIAKAANTMGPGDTVLIRNGDYHETMNGEYANVNITISGTPGQSITYRNYPGHTPVIHVNTWNGIQLWNVAYIEINGLEVRGLPDPVSIVGTPENDLARFALSSDREYFGGGITIAGNTGSHHIRLIGNRVWRVGGNGISGINATSILVQGNRVWGSTHRSQAGNSAISFIDMNDTLSSPSGYGLVIAGNMAYDNRNMLDFQHIDPKQITDGNGIILDLFNESRGYAGYSHRTLIANNVFFDNGGRGVHLYQSDHVDVVNNTLYHNLKSPDLQAWEGELTAVNSSDVVFHNNIAVARNDVRAYHIAVTNSGDFLNNLVISTRGDQTAIGGSNLTAANPLFENASTDPGVADFALGSGSPAIDGGLATLAPLVDIAGTARPQGLASDIGAYEYLFPPDEGEGP